MPISLNVNGDDLNKSYLEILIEIVEVKFKEKRITLDELKTFRNEIEKLILLNTLEN